MKLKYLLDSDVFSLMVKGRDDALNQRMETLAKGEAALSVITTGEFFYGVAHAPVSALLTAPSSPVTQGLLRDATATVWRPGGDA